MSEPLNVLGRHGHADQEALFRPVASRVEGAFSGPLKPQYKKAPVLGTCLALSGG